MRKKALSILLVLTFVLVSVTPVFALDCPLSVTVNNETSITAEPGDIVDVRLVLGVDGGSAFAISAYQDYVCFDPLMVEYVEDSATASIGSAAAQAFYAYSFQAAATNNAINRVYVSRSGSENLTPDVAGGTVLLTFQLKVKEGASGSTAITHNTAILRNADAAYTPATADAVINIGTSSSYALTWEIGNDASWADSFTAPSSASGEIRLPETTDVSRSGYTLTGWRTAPGADPLDPGAQFTLTEDVTFTAVWSELPSYTIRFVMSIPNAPTTVAAPTPAAVNEITAMTGASVTLPTLTHRSYSFRGWSTSAERTDPVSSYTMGNEGVTLYAVWGACTHYDPDARRSTSTSSYTHNSNSTHTHHVETTVRCLDCGQTLSTTPTDTTEACVGTVGANWQSNSTQHWHYCATEITTFDVANHTYVNGVCTVCGYGTTTTGGTGGTGGGEIGGTSVITRINGGTTTGTAIENPSGGTTTIVEEEVPLAGVDNLVLVTVNNPAIGATASGSRNEDGSIKITVKDASGAEVLSIPGGVTAEIHGVTTGQVVVIIDPATGAILDLVEKSLVENGVAYTLLDGSVTIRIIDNAKPFDDVMPYDWFNDSVIFASSHELFNGTAERIFEPNTPMSRGMLVTVLWRLENKPNDFSENVFSDVENETWYTDPVRWATKNGIVKGYDDGTFRPNKEITREEMAAILYRYMDYLKYNVTGRNDLSAYTDASSVAQWALENVQWAVDAGIITGVTADTIQPQTTATRAQVATMFQRIVTGMVK